MSRVGKHPVEVKSSNTVTIANDSIKIKGDKGSGEVHFPSCVKVTLEDNKIFVTPVDDSKESRTFWGTIRSLINNLVIGINEGFKKVLEIKGVGYRASVQGKNLVLQLGFSHDVIFPIPADVVVTCPDQLTVIVEGTDKQKVCQVAANIRELKRTEPYKGKGIRYKDEVILRKEGKKK